MKKRLRRAALASLVIVAPAVAAAEEPRVRARLVADTATLPPGGTVRIGVLFEMAPGWHIYWRNPGDGGLATDVRFELPAGLEAGAVQWPAPIRFEQPGGLDAYGYEGSALLASEVRVAGEPLEQPVTVTAKASWLACRDACVLGSATLEAGWPLPVDEAAFARWRTELPGGEPPFELRATGGLATGVREATLSLWLQWADPPADVGFFPIPGEGLKISDVTVRTRGTLTRVDLEVRALGEQPPPAITAVVTLEGSVGPRRSWEIVVPMAATS